MLRRRICAVHNDDLSKQTVGVVASMESSSSCVQACKHDGSSSFVNLQALAATDALFSLRVMTTPAVEELQIALQAYQESLADLDTLRQVGQNTDETQEVSYCTAARHSLRRKALHK